MVVSVSTLGTAESPHAAFYNGSPDLLFTKQTKQSLDPCHGHNIVSCGYVFSTPPSAAVRWLNKTSLKKILMFQRSTVPAASPQFCLALWSFQIYRGPRQPGIERNGGSLDLTRRDLLRIAVFRAKLRSP